MRNRRWPFHNAYFENRHLFCETKVEWKENSKKFYININSQTRFCETISSSWIYLVITLFNEQCSYLNAKIQKNCAVNYEFVCNQTKMLSLSILFSRLPIQLTLALGENPNKCKRKWKSENKFLKKIHQMGCITTNDLVRVIQTTRKRFKIEIKVFEKKSIFTLYGIEKKNLKMKKSYVFMFLFFLSWNAVPCTLGKCQVNLLFWAHKAWKECRKSGTKDKWRQIVAFKQNAHTHRKEHERKDDKFTYQRAQNGREIKSCLHLKVVYMFALKWNKTTIECWIQTGKKRTRLKGLLCILAQKWWERLKNRQHNNLNC